MNRFAVIAALANAGYYRGLWFLDDVEYDPMSKAFVEEAMTDWLASLPVELRSTRDISGKSVGVPLWVEEVFDCDNHVRSFASFVADAFALDAVKKNLKRGNAAGGKFNFLLNGIAANGHARFWFIDHNEVAHSFDPALGTFTTELSNEQESITGGETI